MSGANFNCSCSYTTNQQVICWCVNNNLSFYFTHSYATNYFLICRCVYSNTFYSLYTQSKHITFKHFFSHPDYTVGAGFAPARPLAWFTDFLFLYESPPIYYLQQLILTQFHRRSGISMILSPCPEEFRYLIFIVIIVFKFYHNVKKITIFSLCATVHAQYQ